MTTETTLLKPARTVTTAEYFYDYAGQDPINGYDLSGFMEESGADFAGGPCDITKGEAGPDACAPIASNCYTPGCDGGQDRNESDSGHGGKGHHCDAWCRIKKAARDVGLSVVAGAGAGAAIGCPLGAAAFSELGPAGMITGCVLSGAAGAEMGAEAGLCVGLEKAYHDVYGNTRKKEIEMGRIAC